MPVESITRFIGGYSYKSYCIFFHGALHTIVDSTEGVFIMSFDINGETLGKIMLPQNYDVEFLTMFQQLKVFKGFWLSLFLVSIQMDIMVLNATYE